MATKRKKTSSSAPTDRGTQYASDVVVGKIVAGPHVRNACQRHLDDLKNGHKRGLSYSVEKAERVMRFFETKLFLNGGQFEGIPFQLHPSQAFKLSCLFGWLRKDGTRRFRRAYIEEGKGNGKSPFAGGVGLYCMMADGEPGAEIYAIAAHKDQAKILFNDAVKMVDQSPDLVKRITQSGGEGRVYNLAWLANGSFFRPLSRSAGKSGSGLRPQIGLADELHEHSNRDAVEMIERGFKFRRQPLLLMITNSGSDRNSICYEEHEHAVKVAAGNANARSDDAMYLGEVIDDTTFSYVCALDKGDDPLNNPSCWGKANPLLGVTISEEYLQGVVEQAKAMPGKLNGILRLHFCIWTDAETAWMSRAALEPCIVDFEPLDEHAGKPAWLGADLSQVKDLTALGYCVQSGTVEGGEHKDKPTEGMKQAAIAAGREPEGLWMPMSVRQVEQLILEGRLRIQRNPVTISAMMSAVTDSDRWGNYWLAKERAVNKIDAAVALCMAVGAAVAFEGAPSRRAVGWAVSDRMKKDLAIDERQGKLLRQCVRRDLLQIPESRTYLAAELVDAASGRSRHLSVHQRVLQRPSPTFISGRQQPARLRRQGGLMRQVTGAKRYKSRRLGEAGASVFMGEIDVESAAKTAAGLSKTTR